MLDAGSDLEAGVWKSGAQGAGALGCVKGRGARDRGPRECERQGRKGQGPWGV